MTTAQDTAPQPAAPRSRRTLPVVVFTFFALLLWARLLLVTNHPRTAIADPSPAPSAAPAPAEPAPTSPSAGAERGDPSR